jgi:hypothetical protein
MLSLDENRNSGYVTDFVKPIFRYNPWLPNYFRHISINEIRYDYLNKQI